MAYIGVVADFDGSGRRRQSDVLDAIFEAVEDRPETEQLKASPFRAAALARLDVPEQVDNLLPIVTRRTWLAAVGVILVIVAFLGYAAATTTVTAITAVGRAVAVSGVVQSLSPGAGVITEVTSGEGVAVAGGSTIAVGVTADGNSFEAVSPATGIVWQSLVLSGGVVSPGAPVATVLPQGSDSSVLVAVPESDAAAVADAIRVDVSVQGQGTVTARVLSVSSSPVPADIAATRIALPVEGTAQLTMVSLEPTSALPPGEEVTVSFILSERTLLQGMLGIS